MLLGVIFQCLIMGWEDPCEATAAQTPCVDNHTTLRRLTLRWITLPSSPLSMKPCLISMDPRSIPLSWRTQGPLCADSHGFKRTSLKGQAWNNNVKESYSHAFLGVVNWLHHPTTCQLTQPQCYLASPYLSLSSVSVYKVECLSFLAIFGLKGGRRGVLTKYNNSKKDVVFLHFLGIGWRLSRSQESQRGASRILLYTIFLTFACFWIHTYKRGKIKIQLSRGSGHYTHASWKIQKKNYWFWISNKNYWSKSIQIVDTAETNGKR